MGARRFAGAYLPGGIGILGAGGIAEGHILRVCPLGSDLGANPSFPASQQELDQLLKRTKSKR